MRIFLCLILFCLPLSADWLSTCNDGDTCRIKSSAKTEKSRKVRLAGIDAPEKKQTHWEQSRDYLVNLLKDKELILECNGKSYDRSTCLIFFKAGGKKIEANEEMVKAGMAWNYPQYSGERYVAAEKQAREKKLGLWKSEKPESPFCFRHVRSSGCRANSQFQP